MHDWDEGQLVLEGGMAPDYVNLFPPMFYRGFSCVYLWHFNMFYAYDFKYLFCACNYLNVV